MLRSRNGRPGLISTAARTAVMVKTANAINNREAARQASRTESAVAPSPVMPPEPAPTAPAGLTDEAIGRLKQLADLHQQGILTEAEFAVQKARILG